MIMSGKIKVTRLGAKCTHEVAGEIGKGESVTLDARHAHLFHGAPGWSVSRAAAPRPKKTPSTEEQSPTPAPEPSAATGGDES
jgi:hypothetical protein